MYIAHVFLIPALIATLLAVHLALVALKHHTQFRGGPRETRAEARRRAGVPRPGAALARACSRPSRACSFLLGGLVQINPIWLWGPYHTYPATNGAQPDWYLGWLIGALRLVPGFDLDDRRLHARAEPVLGRSRASRLAVFGFLYLWPWLERRLTRRPTATTTCSTGRATCRCGRRSASRCYAGSSSSSSPGSADRADVLFGLPYVSQIWVYRVLVFVGPVVAALVAHRACIELQRGERVEHERKQAEHLARTARGRA